MIDTYKPLLVCLACNGITEVPESNGDFSRMVGKLDERKHTRHEDSGAVNMWRCVECGSIRVWGRNIGS